MGRIKGQKVRVRSFDDEKQILINGSPIEKIPMKNCAIHYDDRIVQILAMQIAIKAAQDWKRLNRKGREEKVHLSGGMHLYRAEVAEFFNSSFFGEIIEVILPGVSQEEAVESLTNLDFSKGVLTLGPGRFPRYEA